jgi:hypothetical protein
VCDLSHGVDDVGLRAYLRGVLSLDRIKLTLVDIEIRIVATSISPRKDAEYDYVRDDLNDEQSSLEPLSRATFGGRELDGLVPVTGASSRVRAASSLSRDASSRS